MVTWKKDDLIEGSHSVVTVTFDVFTLFAEGTLFKTTVFLSDSPYFSDHTYFPYSRLHNKLRICVCNNFSPLKI